MSANYKIGAKCLNNLHLKLNDNGILEDVEEDVEYVSSGEVQEEEETEVDGEDLEEENQETIPTATTEAETEK